MSQVFVAWLVILPEIKQRFLRVRSSAYQFEAVPTWENAEVASLLKNGVACKVTALSRRYHDRSVFEVFY